MKNDFMLLAAADVKLAAFFVSAILYFCYRWSVLSVCVKTRCFARSAQLHSLTVSPFVLQRLVAFKKSL